MADNYLAYPVVEQGPEQEANQGTIGAALPVKYLPSLKNYATDDKVREFIRNELAPIMYWTRQTRIEAEEEWGEIRNMNSLKHDSGRRYFGRSDVYLPIYKRERMKYVSALSSGLFPSDEYFDVTDRGTGDPQKAKPVKAYMQWELESNAKLRAYMKPFLSQLADYGTSPIKLWYKKDVAMKGGAKSRIGALSALGPEHSFSKCKTEGLAISPRNLMFWYIYPNTCESLDDAMMVFEDIELPHSYVERMKNAGRWENTDEVIGFYQVPEHERQMQELLWSKHMGSSVPGRFTGEKGRLYTFTELWTNMVLPRDAYMDGEDPREELPVRIMCVGHIPVEVRRNPFYHQKPPYLVGRIDWEPGCFYGNAQGRIIRPLQLLSNDFMNQTNDNGILALNPITLINPGMMLGPPRPFAPGVPWYVADVNQAVKFERPPMEQVGLGLQMSQLLIGMAQDAGGAPPDRGAMGKAAKTATGMQIMQKNAMSPLQDVVEDIEIDVMCGILTQGWKNAQQYRDEAVMASVAGESIMVTPDDLAIDASFRWLASSQAVNNQIRSQQAMSLIQALAPIVPLMMQQGYIVDFTALVRRVYTDGFGFRGFNEFIRKAQAAPGAVPGQPIPPEQMGGVQMEQQDRLRSALEQVQGGGQMEAQPGEGEDFGAVRQQADEMAGMMGGQGGSQY